MRSLKLALVVLVLLALPCAARAADETAPETSLGPEGPAEGSTTNEPSPTFTFTATEASTFECRFDADAFAACSGPGDSHTPAAPLSDGDHTFEVRAIDVAGNADATPAARSFSVDTVAPETTIGSRGPGEGASTNDATPTFDFDAGEAASFQCRFDSAPFATCSGPGAVHTPAAPLALGPHTFEVRAIDVAGNIDQTAALRSFTVAPATRAVTIAAGKTKVGEGRKVRLFGVVDALGSAGCEANATVELLRGPNADNMTIFAELQADATGAYSAKVTVKKTRVYRALLPGSSLCGSATSGVVRVKARRR